MEFIADLHVHSKYSRAVSRNMVLPVMASWAKRKGIDILGTADWTHPLWFREISSQLVEKTAGLFTLKSQIQNHKSQINSNNQSSKFQKETLFILSTEISSIYSQGGKVRRIHNLVLSPSFKTAEKINQELVKRHCNLSSDGRATIGLSAKNVLELILSIDQKALLIPCHAWTPWFSLYGSNSGFDSIEECFGDYSKYIYGIETGLSSDPDMNWRIKELEKRSILSFSDAHSPAKMGRECTVFSERKNGISNISYDDITSAIKQDSNSKLKIAYTIEFYPEEGKYHYTGHRHCQVVQSPEETKKKGVICPVCKKPLTVGVMHRVEQLARQVQSAKCKVQSDQYGVSWVHDPRGIHPPYVKLVPLLEILAESLESTVSSAKVFGVYETLCEKFGSEIEVLLKTPIEEIEKVNARIAEGIKKVRQGNIIIEPGYDGEYGKVKIWPSFAKASEGKLLEKEESTRIFGEVKPKEEPQLSLEF